MPADSNIVTVFAQTESLCLLVRLVNQITFNMTIDTAVFTYANLLFVCVSHVFPLLFLLFAITKYFECNILIHLKDFSTAFSDFSRAYHIHLTKAISYLYRLNPSEN